MINTDFKQLQILHSRNANPNWINGSLYKLLYKEDLYIMAYESIKCNHGSLTLGTSKESLDGFSLMSIQKLIKNIRNESFQFGRARRVQIPKPGGGFRPLGIPNPRDKIVQSAIHIILEAIYDSKYSPTFSLHSHGFRRNHSCHTALQQLQRSWNGINWIVEGDISKCFDQIDHHILISLLKRRITDERFLNLIWKALRAGYMEFHIPVNSISGTPQGSIVSPILCNIYLHELDLFIQNRSFELTKGKRKPPTPQYRNLSATIERERRKYNRLCKTTYLHKDPSPERLTSLARIKSLRKQLLKTSASNALDFVRIKYLRYADDWILGISGNHELAQQLKSEIQSFLFEKLSLNLNLEKTHIRHAKSQEIFFLGTRIRIGAVNQKYKKVKIGSLRILRRVAGWTPMLYAPIDRTVKRCISSGFCDANQKPIPKKAWTILEEKEIIQRYNLVLGGILNYYSFAHNWSELTRIHHLLKMSLAKTLANKFKISKAKVFATRPELLKPFESFKRGFKVSAVKDVLQIYGMKRSKSALNRPCRICGTTALVEMHHVKHIRKGLQAPKSFTAVMARLNRKQIPVCQSCHRKIHRGEYNSLSLKDLA